MKVLIYLGCLFLESLAIVLIKYATGYDFLRMGAIPAMFALGCTLWLSAQLCRKWDDHKALREWKAKFNSQRKLSANNTQIVTNQEQQPKTETATYQVQPNKTEIATRQKGKKNGGVIALVIILATLVVGLSATVVFFATHTQDKEYTITYYNNKGIYFNVFSGEEYLITDFQDNTIYKVEKFSGKYPSEPEPPTNKGFVFLGWYQNPECTDKFLFGHYEINSNINLYAKWVREK